VTIEIRDALARIDEALHAVGEHSERYYEAGESSRRPKSVNAAASTTMPYYVYILRCSDGTLYTGSTNNLAARELAHSQGRGAKYTAGRRPVRIVYSEAHESRSDALKRESQLKRWTRARKEALVAGASVRVKRL
jgi:putative endonuclease